MTKRKLIHLGVKGASHLIVILLILVSSGIVGSYLLIKAHADPINPTRVANAPIIYVHGAATGACPAAKPATQFEYVAPVLKQLGDTGTVDPVDYYACDTGGNSIMTSGDASAYFAGGGYVATSKSSTGTVGGNTGNTDIRHIAYQLAWYIYNKYSSKGQTVEMATHSMGGLITSWMLYQLQLKNPLFPPYLYIQDVVYVSTPFNGVDAKVLKSTFTSSNCLPTVECQQLLPGSAFIDELDEYGLGAQGTGGTDLTEIGGSPCDPVASNPAGTTLAVPNIHKVWYYSNTALPCYNHSSYYTDVNANATMLQKDMNPGDTTYTTNAKGYHSIYAIAHALMSSSY
jgi:triacylglycerol esterase/lipase EstA (alpha/beta hydrolase family)